MTFEKLNIDSQCQCIDDSFSILISDIFCRRIETKKLRLKDLFSYWEEGKFPQNKNNCKDVCKYKAVSLHKFTDDISLLNFYKTTISLRPAAKIKTPFYCKLKLKDGSGKGKHTPSINDPDHYSFFKSDIFNLKHTFVIEIKPIP